MSTQSKLLDVETQYSCHIGRKSATDGNEIEQLRHAVFLKRHLN